MALLWRSPEAFVQWKRLARWCDRANLALNNINLFWLASRQATNPRGVMSKQKSFFFFFLFFFPFFFIVFIHWRKCYSIEKQQEKSSNFLLLNGFFFSFWERNCSWDSVTDCSEMIPNSSRFIFESIEIDCNLTNRIDLICEISSWTVNWFKWYRIKVDWSWNSSKFNCLVVRMSLIIDSVC